MWINLSISRLDLLHMLITDCFECKASYNIPLSKMVCKYVQIYPEKRISVMKKGNLTKLHNHNMKQNI